MGLRSWLQGDDIEIRSSNWMTSDNTVAVSDPLRNWPTARSATSLAMQVPTAVRCVELIATQIAQFPFEAWRDEDRLEDQPRVLRRPDPFSDAYRFNYSTIVDMLFEGVGVWLHSSYDDDGRPNTLNRLPACQTEIRWDPRLSVAEAMRLNALQIKYGGNVIDPADITLVPMLEIPGEAGGVGPVQAGMAITSGQVSADAMVRSNFTEGVFPSGSVEVPTNLSEAQAAKIKQQFMTRNTGSREPVVMSGGAEFKPHAVTARDAQWIEARQWGAAEVARLFGVPAASLNIPIVGGSQVTYNNSTGVRTELLHTGLSPVIARLESAYGMIRPSTQQVHADTTRYLPPLEAVVPTSADPNSPPGDTPNTPQPSTTEAATGGTESVNI